MGVCGRVQGSAGGTGAGSTLSRVPPVPEPHSWLSQVTAKLPGRWKSGQVALGGFSAKKVAELLEI